jgi:hypothetical protein
MACFLWLSEYFIIFVKIITLYKKNVHFVLNGINIVIKHMVYFNQHLVKG